MVIRKYGNASVTMLEGSYENIKVTTPEDIAVAECFLGAKGVIQIWYIYIYEVVRVYEKEMKADFECRCMVLDVFVLE